MHFNHLTGFLVPFFFPEWHGIGVLYCICEMEFHVDSWKSSMEKPDPLARSQFCIKSELKIIN